MCALYTRRARLLHPLLPALIHPHVCRSACIPAQYAHCLAQYKNGLYAGGTNSLYLYLGATLDTCEHGYKVLNTRDDYSNSGGWVRMCDSAKEVCATYTITTATGATRAITTITSSWPLWSPEKWGTAKSNGAHAAVTLTGDTSAFNVRYTVQSCGCCVGATPILTCSVNAWLLSQDPDRIQRLACHRWVGSAKLVQQQPEAFRLQGQNSDQFLHYLRNM